MRTPRTLCNKAATRRPIIIPSLLLILGVTLSGQTTSSVSVHHVEMGRPSQDDVSVPLRTLRPGRPSLQRERPLRLIHPEGRPGLQDAVVQQSFGTALGATAGRGFDGIGLPIYGVKATPPDANGAPGAKLVLDNGQVLDQYVQWVNEDLAVFDKGTGKILYGPVPGNTVWSGFGGPCEMDNDGDPIVQYDALAQRWLLSQFAISSGPPFYQCVAVSLTPDALGPYHRYVFSYDFLNDYPKIGVWPDGYYVSFNMFNGNVFMGPRVCAYDREAMLGLVTRPVTQQCVQLGYQHGALLPADVDGAMTAPAGSPQFLVGLDSGALTWWRFQVDWNNPGNSTLAGPVMIPVAPFTEACTRACIAQTGTTEKLDSIGDRLMYRLAYRAFPDGHEALVVNHSVSVSKAVMGVRWYELRNKPLTSMNQDTPVLYQQGTYAPDLTSRWMGSLAMDKVGNMAIGYSISSRTLHPGIRYSGRSVDDPISVLRAETSIIEGRGSQTEHLSRWGDYTSMRVDPNDDCTFWYTNQYLKLNGTFNWSTRIASFKFPSCS